MSIGACQPSPAFLRTLAVLLALAHALLAVTATREQSFTADEIAHLAAGYTYNTRGDFRLQPENGNLPQRWSALPLVLSGTVREGPSLDSPAWRKGDVWAFGHEFFFRRGVSTDEALFLGRGMIALFSAATALLIFCWSQSLFGWRGGVLSLALYGLCPAFLAHGALATSDVVMTFFFLAAMGAWWRMLRRPGYGRALLSAGVFGLACVAKFSAVLLIPMFGLCTLAWWLARPQPSAPPDRRPAAGGFLAGAIALHLLVPWLVIWTFYGWRFSAFAVTPPETAQFYRGDWAWILDDIGGMRRGLELLRDLRALPEAFLYGFAFVVQFSRERAAFLNGDYSTTGWLEFFPFTFAVKSTLPFLLLLAGGAIGGTVTAIRIRTRDGAAALGRTLLPFLPLAALFVIYWLTSLASNLNIGHRHILPTYPVLFIAAGWLGRSLDLRRPLALAGIAAALLWHAGESWRARPHYLAYFNQLVGGSENGWRHLVDSSLDWGQDLPGLKRWLDANARGEPIFLSYFGTGDPAYEGIRATLLPTLPEVGPARRWHALTPGVYAIGATMLQHVYSSIRGAWTLELEREFQQLRATEPALLAYQDDPRQRAELLRDAPAENWTAAWKRYELLRFARLCHYLRVRSPEGVVGHSIRIYRLTADELRGAVGGSPAEWQALIERAVKGPR